MYVAVKGGERAIDNAHAWLAEKRRGDTAVPELALAQLREQLALAVNRVMAEGSLYDRDLAALAIKQSRGDLIEAIFLIRAYRTTLPRFGASLPIDTGAMACDRRISATFKDLPADRALRLQALARADEEFLPGLAYSTQRGFAGNHAFVGELRIGAVAVEMDIPELGFAIEIGEITVTECESVNQFAGPRTEPAQFTRG
jgi:alpha-D-ribose 1-methylphosphonate 5-triphosphate synthase subunit PhnI